jgi:glycerol-3-phosphate acyltransferase PlsY
MEHWENIAMASFVSFLAIFWGESPMGSSLAKFFFKKDPRDYGSHNSGGTNSGRVFGKWIGILVIALDMVKACWPSGASGQSFASAGFGEVVDLFDDGVSITGWRL